MTKVLDHGLVELIDSMPNLDHARGVDPFRWSDSWGPGDQRIVDAARQSIAGRGVRPVSDDAKLLRYLATNRHTTPFEMVRLQFAVKAPIFVARQWFRHRTGSFNEMSARYGELPDEFYVPDPDRMAKQSASNKQGSGEALEDGKARELAKEIKRHGELAYDLYQDLLDEGLARELARMVLPFNIYTQWWWTTDLHNLMHFLRLRLDSHAQYEIRVYAEAIVELVRPIAPCTVEIFERSINV